MRVHPERDRRICVSEPAGNHVYRHPCLQEHSGVIMPQVVQADSGKRRSGGLVMTHDQLRKQLRWRVGVEREPHTPRVNT